MKESIVGYIIGKTKCAKSQNEKYIFWAEIRGQR